MLSSYGPANCRVAVSAGPYRNPAAAIVALVLAGRANRPQEFAGERATLLDRDAERLELLL
ncbi:hypothetical protein ACYF6T_44445, partial [Streptomyces sp. 7R007]